MLVELRNAISITVATNPGVVTSVILPSGQLLDVRPYRTTPYFEICTVLDAENLMTRDGHRVNECRILSLLCADGVRQIHPLELLARTALE